MERYPRPPLIEAIYEVYPADAPGWSELSYKRLAEQFGAAFDGDRNVIQRSVHMMSIAPERSATATASMVQEPPIHRIWTKPGGELFQFSPSLCAYNVLTAYTSFDDHAPRMKDLFEAWLLEAQPTAIACTAQRYINRIVLPASSSDPAEFFQISPRLPPSPRHRPFALQVVYEQFDRGEVVLNLAHRGEGGDERSGPVYYLDVYARSVTTVSAVGAELQGWQLLAHPHVRGAFENSLTERCRQLFRGVAK